MAKKNTYTQAQVEEIVAKAVAAALTQAGVGKAAKKATGKTQPKAEKVEFVNSKGETKLVSKAQADAWRGFAERKAAAPKRTKEELAQMSASFKFTKAMDAFIKANPSCSQKQFKEKFGNLGMTKQMLHDRKVELKVR